jgi:hypothetical protein
MLGSAFFPPAPLAASALRAPAPAVGTHDRRRRAHAAEPIVEGSPRAAGQVL